ncbi:DNA adenine methylase [soil metagenome]
MMNTPDLTPVRPADPAAPWIGGKKRLARRICQVLAGTPHDAYAEPFVGMGGIFLRRTARPRVEVINDVSGDLTNLYRVLQRHPEALLREFRWRPAMRFEFDRLKGVRIQDLTDIERAARFLYLQTLAFGGKVQHRSFGVDTTQAHNFDIGRLAPRLQRLHDRLAGVVIENLDWADFLPRYDRPGTLFYLDPPYWGSEDDYGPGIFSRGDFSELADALEASQAMVLVSINDRPEVRAAFAWADIETASTTYSLAKGSALPVTELLIGRGVNLKALEPQANLF